MFPLVPVLFAVAAGIVGAELLSKDESDKPSGASSEGRFSSILLIGDSLAVGLAAPMKKIAKTAGMSFSSDAVSGTRADQWSAGTGKTSLERDIATIGEGTLVLVSLGTNDFKAGKVDATRAAVREIVNRFREKGASLVWILPPTMPFSDLGVRAALEDELRSMNARAFDSIKMDGVVPLPRAGDQIHPTPAGYASWADAIAAWVPISAKTSAASKSSAGASASAAPESASQKNLSIGDSAASAEEKKASSPSIFDRLKSAVSGGSSGSSLSLDGEQSTVSPAAGEATPIADMPDGSLVGHYLLNAWKDGRVDNIVWRTVTMGPFEIKVASFPMTVQGYVIPSSARDQYEIAKIGNLMLPTKEMVDATHAQADRQLITITEPVEYMATWRATKEWNQKLVQEIGERDPSKLYSGAWKHWILITPSGSGAVNYGFCKTLACEDNPDGRWQGPGRKHDLDHIDYSQVFQPVWPIAKISATGEEIDLRDYLMVAHAPGEVPGSNGHELLAGPPIDPKWIGMLRA